MTRDEHDAVDAHEENDENDEQHDNEDVNSSAVLAIRQRLAQYALSSPVKRSTASTSSRPTPSPRKRTRSQSTSPRKRSTKAKDSLDTDSTAGVDGNVDEASPRKKAKQAKRGYAAPEKYEHLSSIPDYLREGLDVVLCGINPGYMSAETGHHFAHFTNRFWKCLAQAKLTPRLYSPTEDATLPSTCNIGITNLVPRPTSSADELDAAELRAAVQPFLRKLAPHRPQIIVFVGKLIWNHMEKELKEMYLATMREAQAEEEEAADEAAMEVEAQAKQHEDAEDAIVPTQKKNKKSPIKTKKLKPKPKPKPKLTIPKSNFGLQPFKLSWRFSADSPAEQISDNTETSNLETLLWVVPSTSGLCRHDKDDLIAQFAGAKALSEQLKAGTFDSSGLLSVPVPVDGQIPVPIAASVKAEVDADDKSDTLPVMETHADLIKMEAEVEVKLED